MSDPDSDTRDLPLVYAAKHLESRCRVPLAVYEAGEFSLGQGLRPMH